MAKRKLTKDQELQVQFGAFAELVEDIATQSEISQELVQMIEDAVNCLGIVLVMNDDKFKEFRDADTLAKNLVETAEDLSKENK